MTFVQLFQLLHKRQKKKQVKSVGRVLLIQRGTGLASFANVVNPLFWNISMININAIVSQSLSFFKVFTVVGGLES